MHELDELRQEYGRLSDRKMPTELRNRIHSMIDNHRKAEQDRSVRSGGGHWGWVKGVAAVVVAVCVTAVITVGVMRHVTPQYTTAEPAKNAVQQEIDKEEQPFLNKYKPGTVEKVTSNVTVTPNGDFVVTQTISPNGSTSYSVFYASPKGGKWNVQYTGVKYDPQSNPLPVTIDMNKDGISDIGVGVPRNLSITSVVVQARFTQSGKDIPISLTKVGSLPIWMYNLTADKLNYPTNGAQVWVDSIVAYDRSGDVVWSRNLNKHSSQTTNKSSGVTWKVKSITVSPAQMTVDHQQLHAFRYRITMTPQGTLYGNPPNMGRPFTLQIHFTGETQKLLGLTQDTTLLTLQNRSSLTYRAIWESTYLPSYPKGTLKELSSNIGDVSIQVETGN